MHAQTHIVPVINQNNRLLLDPSSVPAAPWSSRRMSSRSDCMREPGSSENIVAPRVGSDTRTRTVPLLSFLRKKKKKKGTKERTHKHTNRRKHRTMNFQKRVKKEVQSDQRKCAGYESMSAHTWSPPASMPSWHLPAFRLWRSSSARRPWGLHHAATRGELRPSVPLEPLAQSAQETTSSKP